ncbi:MAG: hypothetical protein FE78DRAFT_107500 [Acidomyces sp. 'richmondensis']|nr:MAG: hypothetical protein FE78DRAFT_107500 [Acidomyces sp. 'richmondensis']
MSGNFSSKHGWCSFFWLTVALATFVTILLIFAFPETKWHRSPANHAGVREEKKVVTQVQSTVIDSEANSETTVDAQIVGKGRPSKIQFSPVRKPDIRWLSFVIHGLTAPTIVFFNPMVFWAALMLAGPADLLLLFNLTESGLFSSPAYRWGSGAVRYANFAFFGGGVIGVLKAGPLSDWWAHRATIKNDGIREAEMGLGFSGLALTSIPTISVAYAVDCYKTISGEIMVVATVLKNVLGFCLSYWILNVDARDGWTAVYMTLFAASMFPVTCNSGLYTTESMM